MQFDKSKDFLPVGSVVSLLDINQLVVIIGFLPVDLEEKKWDYLGAPYPYGVINSDENILFNRNQISEVVYSSYSNEVDKKYREKLVEVALGNE